MPQATATPAQHAASARRCHRSRRRAWRTRVRRSTAARDVVRDGEGAPGDRTAAERVHRARCAGPVDRRLRRLRGQAATPTLPTAGYADRANQAAAPTLPTGGYANRANQAATPTLPTGGYAALPTGGYAAVVLEPPVLVPDVVPVLDALPDVEGVAAGAEVVASVEAFAGVSDDDGAEGALEVFFASRLSLR